MNLNPNPKARADGPARPEGEATLEVGASFSEGRPGGKGGTTPIVKVKGLVKIFGDGYEVRALDGVDIEIAEGEMIAIMGASGSGKSTLLHMIGALDGPTAGQIIVDGQDVTHLSDQDAFRSQSIGFVFQLHNLIPTLSAVENVEIPMYETPATPPQRRKRAEELLRAVGLSDRTHFLPNKLSGGQRQRVAIARALANGPRLILADEPTGNLDSKASREIMDLLRHLNQSRGVTIIIVTHDPAVANAADRTITLRDGKVVG